MSNNFQELVKHIGHDVEVVGYQYNNTRENIVNVAVECNTCNKVLFDFDNPKQELADLVSQQVEKQTKARVEIANQNLKK